MCANRVLVEDLECYMDDVVECFEDFVKKSLIVISVGLGIILAMMMYLLKITNERQPTIQYTPDRTIPMRRRSCVSDTESRTSICNDAPMRNTLMESYYRYKNRPKLTKHFSTTGVNTRKETFSTLPANEESHLKNLRCKSSCSGSGQFYHHARNPSVPSKCRISIPSLPTTTSCKQQLPIAVPNQTSSNSINSFKHRGLTGTTTPTSLISKISSSLNGPTETPKHLTSKISRGVKGTTGTITPKDLTPKTSFCVKRPTETMTPKDLTTKTSFSVKRPTETMTPKDLTSKTSFCVKGPTGTITPKDLTSKTSFCAKGSTGTITPKDLTSKTSFCVKGPTGTMTPKCLLTKTSCFIPCCKEEHK